MPRIVDPEIRNDYSIHFKLPYGLYYTLLDESRAKGHTISDHIRRILFKYVAGVKDPSQMPTDEALSKVKIYLEPKHVISMVENHLNVVYPLIKDNNTSRMEARKIASIMLSLFTSLSAGQIARRVGYKGQASVTIALAWYRDVVPYDARLRHDIHKIYMDIKNLEPVMYEIP